MRNLKFLGNLIFLIALVTPVWIFFSWFTKTDKASQTVPATASLSLVESIPPARTVSQTPTAPSISMEDVSQTVESPSWARLRDLASQVEEYNQLSVPSDQDWVLENAENSLKAGNIRKEELSLHISQLSSIRMFTVLERQESYSDPEPIETNHGNEENL